MQHNIPTPGLFKARKGDAEATLRLFDTWTKNMGRYFQLTKPRNQAGAPVDHTETEKMALALLIGGQGLEDLLKYTGKVVVEEKIEADDPAQSTYTAALTATKAALTGQVNPAALVHELFTMQQKDMLFSEYMPKVLKVAQKLKWQEMTYEKAAMYAMTINTSSDRLRRKALAEQMEFARFRELGLAYETAEDQAGKLEVEEKVRATKDKSQAEKSQVEQLQEKVRQLQASKTAGTAQRNCQHCHPFSTSKQADHDCRAKSQTCNRCSLVGHFACSKLCKKKKQPQGKSRAGSIN